MQEVDSGLFSGEIVSGGVRQRIWEPSLMFEVRKARIVDAGQAAEFGIMGGFDGT